jgi:hypothetical protein
LLDSTGAYWLAGSNGKIVIWRGALSNGTVTETVTNFPLNTTTWEDLATDGKKVFWIDGTAIWAVAAP